MPATDDDRALVASLLVNAHAEGRLDDSEVDQRLDLARRAETLDDLVLLTADLVELG